MRVFRVAVVAAFILGASLCTADTAAYFKAGVASRDITPRAPMPMWGYGERHDTLSTGVLDPLTARAVVIDTGADKLAIVGVDLGRAPDFTSIDTIRAAVRDRAGVAHIMIVASHTHCGPVLELVDKPGRGKGKFEDAVRYVAWLEEQIIECIVDAANNVADARIGWGSKSVDLNYNRQSKLEPAPRDTELAVIRIDDLTGNPIAVLVNFAAHPINIHANVTEFSAEYPGAMRNVVDQQLGGLCIFLQGAAGDLKCKKPEGAKNYLLFGQLLGREVVEIASGIVTKPPAIPSINVVEREFLFDTRLDFDSFLVPIVLRFALFPELARAVVDKVQNNRIEAHLLTVLLNGELALVGGSGEFFCDHAIRLKSRSRAAKALFFGYCNGYSMYFPTIEAAAEGGYGADELVGWAEIGAGEQMIDAALIDIYSMLGAYQLGGPAR